MVQLIVGEKGKGKTKYMLDKVNTEIKNVSGNIAYLDRSTKHMYELNNKVRLIDVSDYFIDNKDEFLGFIAGIISQDHDLEQMYFDGFLAMSNTPMSDFEKAVEKLEKYSEKHKVDFVLSVSATKEDIPASLQDRIIVAL